MIRVDPAILIQSAARMRQLQKNVAKKRKSLEETASGLVNSRDGLSEVQAEALKRTGIPTGAGRISEPLCGRVGADRGSV